MRQKFIAPPIIKKEGFEYHGCHSYSEYNYLQKSFISSIKRRHFDIVLDLTSKYFYKTNVIDFGCADGIFLPTLSFYFCSVLGIERNKNSILIAQKMIDELSLKNVIIVDNEIESINKIKKEYIKKDYGIIFLLEVLEHIGTSYQTMYEDKITFLKEIFSLVENTGIIVLSVPKMVGISFFIQSVGLSVFNLTSSEYSFKELIKPILFKDTSDIEKYWVPDYTHKGFNHKKLERYLEREFFIVNKIDDFFQVLYVIKQR